MAKNKPLEVWQSRSPGDVAVGEYVRLKDIFGHVQKGKLDSPAVFVNAEPAHWRYVIQVSGAPSAVRASEPPQVKVTIDHYVT